MRLYLLRLAGVALSTCLLLSSGCASSLTSHFYVLSHLSAATPTVATTGLGLAIGVGPVELPDYLDRPQIVSRTSQNELTLAEFDRWAEPLKDNFTQVLAENLAVLLPSQRVVVYPWRRATPVDYQLVVKVIRFDLTVGGDSVLNTRWSVLSSDGRQTLLTRESSYTEHPAGDDYPAIVTALNQTLAAFSRDVAAALKGLPRLAPT
jgi:uncharacterized lipoprotein YmbA